MSKHTSKKVNNNIIDCPKTLDDHIFYGLTLDNEQKHFRDCIWSDDYDIIFCDARAGTGKTLVAVATSLLLYNLKNYDSIVYVVSPTQEDRIGFLPGGPEEKLAPYMGPLSDALLKIDEVPDKLINQISVENLKEGTSYIDCVSHLYLRGINFDNKIIIIDEAQNMYLDELQKTLTRVVDTCKIIVIGHCGQCDLYKNPIRSGFNFYKEWYKNEKRAAICELNTNHRGWVSKHADSLDIVALCEFLEKNKNKTNLHIDLNDFRII